MSTAVWSYHPTEGVTETTQAAVRGDAWGPRAALYSTVTANQLKRWELSWGPAVASAECNSMLAFYRARLGSFDSFVWQSPIDARTYQVRFDSTIKADLFLPGWFRAGAQLAFLQVHSPNVTPISAVSMAPPEEPAAPNAIQRAGAWHLAGGFQTEQSFERSSLVDGTQLEIAPFFLPTSAWVTGLGVIVYSADATASPRLGVYWSTSSSTTQFNVLPSSLVAEANSQLSVASLGFTWVPCSMSLPPGAYWAACAGSATAVRVARFTDYGMVPFMGQDSGELPLGGSSRLGGFMTYSDAALPAQFAASLSLANAAKLAIWYRVGSF